jgi:hypothetical protein
VPGPLHRGDKNKNSKKWSDLKVFSRTTGPEKLKFTWKLSDIAQKQVYLNYGPRGSGRATIGETVLDVFIQKKYY